MSLIAAIGAFSKPPSSEPPPPAFATATITVVLNPSGVAPQFPSFYFASVGDGGVAFTNSGIDPHFESLGYYFCPVGGSLVATAQNLADLINQNPGAPTFGYKCSAVHDGNGLIALTATEIGAAGNGIILNFNFDGGAEGEITYMTSTSFSGGVD